MKKIQINLLTLVFLVLCCGTASANVPIGGALFLAYPAITYIQASILALVIVIVLESVIFIVLTGNKILLSVIIVLVSNIVSSIVGLLLCLSYVGGGPFVIAFVLLALMLGKMLGYICKKADSFKMLAKCPVVYCVILQIIVVFPGYYILPLTNRREFMYSDAPTPNMFIAVLCIFIIMAIGFFFTLITEWFTAIRILKREETETNFSVLKAVYYMNLASYVILTVLYGKQIIGRLISP